ncbi:MULTISPECIES: lanthionine synthetase LanC family protein [Staphylococcus]|uniref:lanthionine synthetase LanC family protein n=1 Tax=Staphylococcus saprophyticus TaxID=29385 RepID=UPI0015F15948|nr:lanthionine synthetase LanC family protein [Staphylococcus saprophyticus]
MSNQEIIKKAYNSTENIFIEEDLFSVFIKPIYNLLVEHRVYDKKLIDIIQSNYNINSIHLKNTLSESIILFTNKAFEKSNFTDIKEMIVNESLANFVKEFYGIFESLSIKVIDYILEVIDYYQTIYTDIQNNQKIIYQKFKCKFEDVLNIKINLGDRHCNSIPTTLIEYKDSTLYYKNKENLYEDLFYEIFNFFDCDFKYETSLKINNGYLQRQILYERPTDLTQTYKNAGKLIFISYFLGISDLHYENIILNNNYFMPIDCETVFDLDTYYKSDDLSISYNLRNSVANTGLLPFKSINGLVLSGFSCHNEPIFNNDIKITFEKKKVLATNFNNSNFKRIRDKKYKLDFYENIEYLLSGFEDMYLKYLNSDKKIIHNIIFKLFNGINSRLLYRNTYEYYEILKESYHPYLLLSNSRLNYFSEKNLTSIEEKQLIKGFIPIDYKNINLNKKYFEKFSVDDLNLQKCIIYECFIAEKAFFNKNSIDTFPNKKQSPESYLKDYIFILKKTYTIYKSKLIVLDFIIIGDDKKGYDFEVTIMPKDLYLGTSGIALFLNNYLNNFPDKELYNLLNYIDADLKLYMIEAITLSSSKTGYFDGLSGILHVLIKINFYSQKKNDDSFDIEYIISKLYSIENKKDEMEGDIINGSIGFLYFLSEYYKYNDDDKIKNYIYNLTQKYLQSKVSNSYLGFAHGIAGEIYVLNKVQLIINNDTLNNYIEGHYNQLTVNLNDETYNWNISKDDKTEPINWCHGSPGILLVYPQNKYNLDWPIDNIIKNIIDNKTSNLCLCHGLVGNFWILNYLYKKSLVSFNKLNYYMNKTNDKFLNEFEALYYNKSFMIGGAGILNTLLISSHSESLFI